MQTTIRENDVYCIGLSLSFLQAANTAEHVLLDRCMPEND